MKATLAVYGHFTLDVLLPDMNVRVGGPPTYIIRGLPADRDESFQVTLVSRLSMKDTDSFMFLSDEAFLLLEFSDVSTRFSFSPENMYREMRLLEFAGEIHQVVPAKLALVSPVLSEVPVELLRGIREESEVLWLDMQGYFRVTTSNGRIMLHAPDDLDGILGVADLVKVSMEEARVLTGKEEISDVLMFLGRLAKQFSCIFILTRGKEGSNIIWEENDTIQIAHVKYKENIQVIDTTGAGDSFMGALAYSFLSRRNLSLVEHVRFAACMSTLVIQSGTPDTRVREKDVLECVKKVHVEFI